MQPPPHVFREYDIRGHAERDLDDTLVRAIGRALATYLRKDGSEGDPTVAVCRDCRLSSDRIFEALVGGLRASGANVIDIGRGPTPLLYFAAFHLDTSGAVMITGSHNPPEDNGLKMMQGKSTLFGRDVQTLKRIVQEESFHDAAGGSFEERAVNDAYLDSLEERTKLDGAVGDIRVVLDAGNGAAGPLAVEAFARLGIPAETLFCEMDGQFPNHHPDPTVEENLVHLKEAVAEHDATLGIAFDGDGDRIGVIDDAGDVIWGDKLMILFGRNVLLSHPGAAILGEVKCSQTLFDDIADKGGRPVICRTGHSLIKKRMKEEEALLAGEMSGHIFFADRYYGFDDAIYAAARLVEIVAHARRSPRELLSDVPPTSVTPEIRVSCPDEIKFDVVERVTDHYRKTHDVLDVDGARISFGDGAWGLCRASNTGPVLVLRFEARDAIRRDEIRKEVESVVAEARAHLENA
jgi:phosphomannomutase/phosphoglucomutase